MYTLKKDGNWKKLEKTVVRRTNDSIALVTVEASNSKDNSAPAMFYVSALVAPFGAETRHFSQFFWGDAKEAWKAFKGFQTLLGGVFNDD